MLYASVAAPAQGGPSDLERYLLGEGAATLSLPPGKLLFLAPDKAPRFFDTASLRSLKEALSYGDGETLGLVILPDEVGSSEGLIALISYSPRGHISESEAGDLAPDKLFKEDRKLDAKNEQS
jgi:hypothetical protein